MGLSVLTEPTARAQAMLSPLAAGGPLSPKVRALIAEAPGGSMPRAPPCTPKRSALTADDLEIDTGDHSIDDAMHCLMQRETNILQRGFIYNITVHTRTHWHTAK